MNFTKKLFFLLIAFLSQVTLVLSQIQGSGKEFWIGYMDNYRIAPNAEFPDGLIDRAILEIVAVEDANGKILFKGQEVSFNLSEGQSFNYVFPESAAIITREDGEITDNGVRVLSDGNIMVYAYNQREKSMDATSILPFRELSDEYWVIDHNASVMAPGATFDGVTEAASSFLIVALEDETTVEIIPSTSTFDGKVFNTPYNVTLQSGQTYQVKARWQLTGSRIRVIQQEGECKKIAVFAGNRWGNNGGVGPDNSHMYVQMLGNEFVSEEFIQVPSLPMGTIDKVGFFTPDLEGFVSVNGNMDPNPLGLGILAFNFLVAPNFLKMTNAGFAMWKFTSLSAFGNPAPTSGLGDPALTYLLGLDQMVNRSLFSVRNIPTIAQHMLIIVAKETSKDLTVLDGVNIGGEFQTHPNIPGYAFVRKIISPGIHKLENPEGFNAYQYGYGFNESYVLTLFQSDRSLESEVASSYDFVVEGERTACLLKEGVWNIQTEDLSYLHFVWDFGDQSETKNGNEVHHTFTEPGIYNVEIEARKTDDLCEIPEIIRFEVEVEDNRGVISGPDRVCPVVDEFDYFFIPEGDIRNVEWEVEGGEIMEELSGFGIKVLWGAPNDSAFINAVAFTSEGCPSEEFVLPVTIRRILEPQIPIGPDISCVSLGDTVFYEIPEVLPNRGYRWIVEGGDIIGDNGLETVQVAWHPSQSSGLIWYEEFSLNDEFCEGVSDQLEVSLVDALVVSASEVRHVLCHGESTGSIALEVQGGSGNFTFKWSHDPTLNSPIGENLNAGLYTVSVLDASGCQGYIEDIEITEPEFFRVIEEIEVEDVSCFGQSDGNAQIRIEGGIPPYSMDYPTFEQHDEFLFLKGLQAGEYSLEIRDTNNCLVIAEFVVSSPLPLEVEVVVESRSCPGGSAGVLKAIPQGGIGPFSYNWNGINQFGEIADGLSAGEYEVEVTDSNGCVGFGKINLTDGEPILRMPTGFYPENELEFKGVSNCPIDFELFIYNRWGQLIFNGVTGWDGKVGDQEVPQGTYTYRINYTYFLEGALQGGSQIGSFLLIK